MTTTFEILLPVWFLIIAGICKAVNDTLAHHFDKSVFNDNKRFSFTAWQWWNPAMSWPLKYKGGIPEKGAAFPGSTTVFVFLTDAWHLFNAIQYLFFFLAIVWYWPVYGWWIDAILLKCIFTITFEVFYRWVLKKESTR